MKVFVVKKPNNKCSIIIPFQDLFNSESEERKNLRRLGIDFETEEDILKYIANKDIPTYRNLILENETDEEGKIRLGISNLDEKLSYRITDSSNIPSDRIFREAWHDENSTETVDIDINRAKDIKKDQFRALREPLLKALDIEFQRALEEAENIKRNEIIAKKQELRDVTKIELPEDFEELKNFIPDCLRESI